MLLVKTRLAPSPIHGIGLFAAEWLAQHQEIWRFCELDELITAERMKKMWEPARATVLKYCYVNPRNPRFVVLCADDARFMNFSDDPNLQEVGINHQTESRLCAARDIEEGEELTVHVSSDADATRKLGVQEDVAQDARRGGQDARAPRNERTYV